MTLTVGWKLKLLTIVSFGLLAVMAGTGLFSASTSSGALADLQRADAALQKSLQVDMSHDGLRGDVYFALFSDDPAAIAEVAAGMAERIDSMHQDFYAIEEIQDLASRPANDALKLEFAKTKDFVDGYLNGSRAMLEALQSGKDAARQSLNAFESSFVALVDPMESLSDTITKSAEEAAAAAGAAAATTSNWIWVILGIASIVLFVFSHRIGSGILHSIAVVRELLDGMANKRFDVRAEIHGDDELAGMARAAIQTSSAIASAINDIAGGAQQLAGSASQLQQVATRMEDAAAQTHEHATKVAQTSDEVRVNSESTAAGGGQMRASIEEISHRCTDAAGAAQDAVRCAEAARASMEALVAKSDEIGEVVRFISSIAEQTNLLALNATIESARAGESGRGFAVVANEVKSLALETARSTSVVREKVAAIQTETNKVGDLIGQIHSVIQRIDGIQGTIAGAIQEQTATTSEMAESMAAVSSGAVGIKSSVDEVTTHARVASSASREVASASESLSRIASEMTRLVGEFRVSVR